MIEKMTDKKTVEALKYCINYTENSCEYCPYRENEQGLYCVRYLTKESLDLINRLTEEVRLLTEENDQLDSENEWLRAYLNQPIKLRQALEDYMNSQNPKKEGVE